MPVSPLFPTPYPEVNALLRILLVGVRDVLKERFRGLYLYGSLATGDFDPAHSDIDFVVTTGGELPPGTVRALGAMHARLLASGHPWAKKLEGSYIPEDALRRYDPADPPRPTLNEGAFFVDRHGSDWVIQRHVLREHGVVLAGPHPGTRIDPVGPEDLRRAVAGILREWWAPIVENPARLRSPGYVPYAVFTMCRALHTLHHGTVASKPVAARWAREALGEPWAPLIERALSGRLCDGPEDLEEAKAFIRYTVGRGAA